jgi:hypothetical protein
LLLLCASPNGSLSTPVTRSPSLPSARSVFGTRRYVAHEALPPHAIGPRCQLVNVLLPIRSPQSLLHPPPPVKGHGHQTFLLHFRRTLVAPRLPGALRSRRPSLKEPRKVTTESLLCQVDGCRTEAQFAYPYLSGRHLPDSK